ncbi:MAG: hypothetical protein KAS32_12450 [Candidatus Peribacteraceae bacterium]|nr:hypothetical protein [Candidatus Peribacteraceae bacterium]
MPSKKNKIQLYKVSTTITIGGHITVEAINPSNAEDIAKEKAEIYGEEAFDKVTHREINTLII